MYTRCMHIICMQTKSSTSCNGGNGMPDIVWESTFVKKSEREREHERPVVRETDWPTESCHKLQ